MKLGEAALDRATRTIEKVIANVLNKVLRDREVQVTMTVKTKGLTPQVEPYNARSMYNPKVHVSE